MSSMAESETVIKRIRFDPLISCVCLSSITLCNCLSSLNMADRGGTLNFF